MTERFISLAESLGTLPQAQQVENNLLEASTSSLQAALSLTELEERAQQALVKLKECLTELEQCGNKHQQAQVSWIRACLSLTSAPSSLVKQEQAQARGRSRAASLTPERRSEIARIAAKSLCAQAARKISDRIFIVRRADVLA